MLVCPRRVRGGAFNPALKVAVLPPAQVHTRTVQHLLRLAEIACQAGGVGAADLADVQHPVCHRFLPLRVGCLLLGPLCLSVGPLGLLVGALGLGLGRVALGEGLGVVPQDAPHSRRTYCRHQCQ